LDLANGYARANRCMNAVVFKRGDLISSSGRRSFQGIDGTYNVYLFEQGTFRRSGDGGFE